MARPRVFVSSTYYDLKHIRSSLEIFVESLGFEPILSEKGDIAFSPDVGLDESCYREAASADIFVLVVGGRYGSESGSSNKLQHSFFERYESITKKEFEAAQESNVPIFILIESGVYGEYQTFLRNRGNDTIKYAHVDSANIFHFIESILSLERNNPTFQFERSAQIEGWLRDQWAGLFRELLRTRTQKRQIADLTTQVAELKSVSGS
jgi:hypothetical protein